MKEQNRKIYSFDDFQLDAGNRQLRRDDKPLPLPAKAFDLLLALVENNGRLVEKDELFRNVWQDQIVEESNLTVHISQIRKALGENKNKPRYIETVPGYGYRFAGNVSNLEDEEIVIETETLSRITIEKEIEVQSPKSKAQSLIAMNNGQRPKTKLLFLAAVASISLIACFIIAFGVYKFYFNSKTKKTPPDRCMLECACVDARRDARCRRGYTLWLLPQASRVDALTDSTVDDMA